MFKNTYQSGFLSILYSIGSKPLQIWDKDSKCGFMQFITGTSNGWQTRTSNLRSWKSWAPMSQLRSSPAPRTPNRRLESNSPSSSWSSKMYLPFHSVEKVLHLLGASPWWQERPQEVQSFQLPVDHSGQAFYLYYADETWRGVEPDPVQLIWFHQEGLWQQLYRNSQGDHPR